MITVLSTLGFMLLTTSASSMGKPATCPSLALIKSVGIQHIDKAKVGSDDWVAWSKSNYNTDDSWLFAISFLTAKNKNMAIKRAMKKLENLAIVEGPGKVDGGKQGCLYFARDGHMIDMAIAVTPPPM